MTTDTAATISRILQSRMKDSSVRVYLFLYCDAGSFDEATRITSKEISDSLKMNRKTVFGALSELKFYGYVVISGKTSNRQITCIDPYLINEKEVIKAASSEKKTLQVIINENLELEKWFADYINEVDLKMRVSDIFCYIKEYDICISELIHNKVIAKGTPVILPEFSKNDYRKFIVKLRQKENELNVIEKRAGEYDYSHRKVFQNDLKDFFINNEYRKKFSKYITCSYNNLSKFPIDFKKAFLNWLEPELF
ncbi:MAG TPA: hypothetical protein QF753_00865 [Victivallales bacterium]|nr:hypothetical protein [Victivallales bacterium]